MSSCKHISSPVENRRFRTRSKEYYSKDRVAPQYLELEVTESIFDNDADNLIDILTQLSFGVTITIDDFGIEYSSFRRLKSLPVDH